MIVLGAVVLVRVWSGAQILSGFGTVRTQHDWCCTARCSQEEHEWFCAAGAQPRTCIFRAKS